MDKKWVEEKTSQWQKDYDARKENIKAFISNCDYYSSAEKETLIKKIDSQTEGFKSLSKIDFLFACHTSGLHAKREGKSIDFDKAYEYVKEKLEALQVEEFCSMYNYGAPYERYLDSDEVEFDGDIIITDPCYVMKHPSENNAPDFSSFMRYDSIDKYPDYNSQSGNSEMYISDMKAYRDAKRKWDEQNPDDWTVSDFGFNMEALGINHYMTRDTIYGDWSCSVFDANTKEEIGNFCADAGLVSVFLLDEILKYNPAFDYHINKKWTTALIKDFKGTVKFVVKGVKYKCDWESPYHKLGEILTDYEVEVVGHGINKTTGKPIDFVGTQTGL